MDFDIDEEESSLDWFCPNCGHEYDGLEYQFQVCDKCGHMNDDNVSLDETP